uniref:Ubiquitin-like domain-containing protein n=1 Tax=Phasianus colchicus TaxID=9054 RepID=A0A669QQC3_PHACC
MIRRHKTTIFTDAKESSTVLELKRIVEGILKRPPEEQRLYKVLMGSLMGLWAAARGAAPLQGAY